MNYFERAAGVLLHPTSLPGPYGIGDLGPAAHGFVDWLAEAGCRLWQVLPLGPTGFGNSPYQSHSVFAGNPLLISPDLLAHDGLLTDADVAESHAPTTPPGSAVTRVDYGWLVKTKPRMLRRAFERFQEMHPDALRQEFSVYRAANTAWLEDFALFMALKESNGGRAWNEWAVPLRSRHEAALADARQRLGAAVERFAFYQWLFFRQWLGLRDHAHARGIRIIGDLPIFAAHDSAEVWAHPELFCLDPDGNPQFVSGVPPDYFSPTGQLWGNPTYRWSAHQRDGYSWWLQRVRATLSQVDIMRLDHFRGFLAYWEVPAGNPTAEIGRWTPGPAEDLFDVLRQKVPIPEGDGTMPIIAEDLGVITPDVLRLRDKYGLPGMKVLQFAFSGPENSFLPHNYVPHCVAYTGTHDNDTARGWYGEAAPGEAAFARRYLRATARNINWAMICCIWASVAALAIAPMQDLLNLPTEARMNYPGRADGNWVWRIQAGDLSELLAKKLLGLNVLYGRYSAGSTA